MARHDSQTKEKTPTLYSLTVSDYSLGKWRCCLSITRGDKKEELTFGIRDLETLSNIFSAVAMGRVQPGDLADITDNILAQQYGE